jgi:hypothetical protein
MALGDSAVDASLIVGSITDEGGDWTCDLVEQRIDLGAWAGWRATNRAARSPGDPDRDDNGLSNRC